MNREICVWDYNLTFRRKKADLSIRCRRREPEGRCFTIQAEMSRMNPSLREFSILKLDMTLVRLDRESKRFVNKKDKPHGLPLVLHILVEKDAEAGFYSALCLDFDLASQGKTVQEAERNLFDAIDSLLETVKETGNSSLLMRAAPKDEWKKFNALKIGEATMKKELSSR